MKDTFASTSKSRIVLAVCVLAATALGLGWSLLSGSDHSPEGRDTAVRPAAPVTAPGEAPATESGTIETAQATAPASQGAQSAAATAPASFTQAPPGIPGGTPSQAPHRSPLERSPGYYPPDDPESMSVVTGRRDAPAVNLEFAGGGSSLRDLGSMLVQALNARDERALHNLRVTRQEFEVILWREFPQSRPITNITADDAWEMATAQNLAGVSRTIASYGGRDLELLDVQSEATQEFRNFMLYRGVRILVRERGTGQEHTLRFAPSIAERHGRYKVQIYKD